MYGESGLSEGDSVGRNGTGDDDIDDKRELGRWTTDIASIAEAGDRGTPGGTNTKSETAPTGVEAELRADSPEDSSISERTRTTSTEVGGTKGGSCVTKRTAIAKPTEMRINIREISKEVKTNLSKNKMHRMIKENEASIQLTGHHIHGIK